MICEPAVEAPVTAPWDAPSRPLQVVLAAAVILAAVLLV
jgi:hypothetical protein